MKTSIFSYISSRRIWTSSRSLTMKVTKMLRMKQSKVLNPQHIAARVWAGVGPLGASSLLANTKLGTTELLTGCSKVMRLALAPLRREDVSDWGWMERQGFSCVSYFTSSSSSRHCITGRWKPFPRQRLSRHFLLIWPSLIVFGEKLQASMTFNEN